jgi:hypothetical protein
MAPGPLSRYLATQEHLVEADCGGLTLCTVCMLFLGQNAGKDIAKACELGFLGLSYWHYPTVCFKALIR